MSNFDLNKHMHRLLMKEPFFAAISLHMNKIPTHSIPTLGVAVDEKTGQFDLLYNPDFLSKQRPEHLLGILKHEFYHIILHHVIGRKPTNCSNKKWNIATDLAINGLIPRSELPDIALIPGEKKFKELPSKRSAEWYYTKVLDVSSEGFDSHDKWFDEEVGERHHVAEEKMKAALKSAAEECRRDNNWGSLDSDVKKKIKRIAFATSIDPEKVLRFFVKNSRRSGKKSSIKKLSKKLPYLLPGKKVVRKSNIAICIDQSGSVSDTLLSKFFSLLEKFSGHASFFVIPFSDNVIEDQIFEWKKGEKRKLRRVSFGGTSFINLTRWLNKEKYDGVIICTDMMAKKPGPLKNGAKRLWITTKTSKKGSFLTNERVLVLE